MSRAIWKGYISFGLVSIPVHIESVEEKNEVHFHLLDAKDESRIRYQRINTNTGKEVPWDEVVKGYEYEKGSYLIVDEKDFEKTAPEAFKSINIDEFVDIKDIDPLYFDRPYYLIPEGMNNKAYVLLREALKKTNKVGVAKVIIRTKEYLSLIMSHKNTLVLNLIHFKAHIREEGTLNVPKESLKSYKIKEAEINMAVNLIKQMSAKWQPEKYHDEYQATLDEWIHNKMKGIKPKKPEAKVAKREGVVDFMSLLKKSMAKTKKSGEKKRAK